MIDYSTIFLSKVIGVYPVGGTQNETTRAPCSVDLEPLNGMSRIRGARVVQPFSGGESESDSASNVLPSMGDVVLTLFVDGNINNPICLGCIYRYDSKGSILDSIQDDYTIRHNTGSFIRFRNTASDKVNSASKKKKIPSEVLIQHNTGSQVKIAPDGAITMYRKGAMVRIAKDGTIILENSGNIQIENTGNVTIENGGNTKINSSGTVSLGDGASYHVPLGEVLKSQINSVIAAIKSHTHIGVHGPTGAPLNSGAMTPLDGSVLSSSVKTK